MPYHRSRKRRRRVRLNLRGIIAALIAGIVLLAGVAALIFVISRNSGANLPTKEKTLEPVLTSEGETLEGTEEETTAPLSADIQAILDEASVTADMYDYQAAISYVKENIPDYEDHEAVIEFISDCEARESKLIKWPDNSQITHIFFHTLIQDSAVAFGGDKATAYNQVMTTIEEFDKIIQQMYDRGYVLVRMQDIASIDPATGQMNWNPIYLPEGKIPFVLSEDDVSYYEYMNVSGGYAQRLVVTEDGKIMNEKDNDDGTVTVGAFDVLPRLDAFIEEHPDFSYRGAKGIIALTGYNGILGYRTSYVMYGNQEVYQQNYSGLFENPGLFDTQHAVDLANSEHAKEMDPGQHECMHIELTPEEIEDQRAKAKVVADAIRADGWDFASHSWGHMTMSDVVNPADGAITSERFYRDTQWWEYEVEPLIGETEIIIFARGADIATWRPYTDENAAFQHLKSVGFNYYANVDSSRYFVQMSKAVGGSGFLRQGRRNLDGMLMFKALLYPEKELLSDLIDTSEVFDPARPLPVEGVILPDWYDGTTLIKPQWAIDADAAAAAETAAGE